MKKDERMLIFEMAKRQKIRKAAKKQFRNNVKRLAEKVDERSRKEKSM